MALLKRGGVITVSDIASSIYEWNKDISYKHPCFVLGQDHKIYFSTADSTNVNPVTDKGHFWRDYFKVRASTFVPVGSLIHWLFAKDPVDTLNSDGTRNWLECNRRSN